MKHKKELQASRETLQKLWEEGLSGIKLLEDHSAAIDSFLTDRFAELSKGDQGLTLVALGGYGRRELFPFSDIDLLLLHSPRVKGAALESLGAASHPRVSSLIEDAYDSGDLDLQKSALFAMGRSADRRWLSVVRDEMMSSIVEMRLEAARASGGIGHEEAIPELGELISDEGLEVRLAAVAALGLIGGAVAQEILEDLSADPETADLHEAAREAAEELDWLGSKIDLSLLDWENDRDEDAIL